MHSPSSLVKCIGKVAVVSLIFSLNSTLQGQFCDTVPNDHWPSVYSGDTQFFARKEKQISSNYTETEKGDFTLKLKIPSTAQTNWYVRFDLELMINLSSTNTFSIGFIDTAGNEQFFKIGNTQDRWEAYSFISNNPLNIGRDQEFAGSNVKCKIQLMIIRDSLVLTTYHHSIKYHSQILVPMHIKCINDFFIRIQQSGKTAFQAHRISNIQINNLWNQQINLRQIKQLHKSIEIEFPIPINPNLGIIQINKSKCHFTVNPDYLSISINLNYFDTSLLEIALDSFYSIWSEKLTIEQLHFSPKFISPVKRGDIVFSEIMSNPEPAMNRFPATEYIELYNNSNHYKWSNEFQLFYKQKNIELPDSLIPPESTILLVPLEQISSWKIWQFNNALSLSTIWGIQNFPNLINSEGTATLKLQDGTLLDSIHYESNMHLPFASNGGFSFENTNLNPLSNNLKWKTTSTIGGSPTMKNGEYNQLFPIEMVECYKIKNDSIHFRLNIHSNFIDTTRYISDTLLINFNQNPKEIEIVDVVQTPKYFEKLIINEIYIKSPSNNDYIEIFNPNNIPVYLELYDLLIYDKNRLIKQVISLKREQRSVIMPQELLVICKNSATLFQEFDSLKIPSILEIKEFPNLLQEGGYITLINQISGKVDESSFEITQPQNRITERNTSIEKIHPLLSSCDPQSWLDCVLNTGTPTKKNSTFIEEYSTKNKKWTTIPNKRIVINKLGYYELTIELNTPIHGCLLSGKIYSIWGEHLLDLNNEVAIPSIGSIQCPIILSEKPFFPGNYIVTFEIANQISGTKLEFHRISLL